MVKKELLIQENQKIQRLINFDKSKVLSEQSRTPQGNQPAFAEKPLPARASTDIERDTKRKDIDRANRSNISPEMWEKIVRAQRSAESQPKFNWYEYDSQKNPTSMISTSDLMTPEQYNIYKNNFVKSDKRFKNIVKLLDVYDDVDWSDSRTYVEFTGNQSFMYDGNYAYGGNYGKEDFAIWLYNLPPKYSRVILNKMQLMRCYAIPECLANQEFWRNMTHNQLDALSILLYFMGPVGIAGSFATDAYNASLYYQEGDKWEFGLRMIFLGIPLNDLVQMIPGVKKLGKEGLKKLSDKLIQGLKLSPKEINVIIDFMKKWDPVIAPFVKKYSRRQLRKQFSKLFTNASLYGYLRYLALMKRAFPTWFSLTTTLGTIGGVIWTYGEIMAKYGIYPGGESKLSEEQINISFEDLESDFIENKESFENQEEEKFLNAMESIDSPETQKQAEDALEALKEKRGIK